MNNISDRNLSLLGKTDPKLAGFGVENGNQEGAVPAQSALPPILSGNSLSVSVFKGGLDVLVAKLGAETRSRREDFARTQMLGALSAVLGRIELKDSEQAAALRDIGKLAGELEAAQKAYNNAVDAKQNDPRIKVLEVEVKRLEALVESLRKTPEELKKEAERKRDLQTEGNEKVAEEDDSREEQLKKAIAELNAAKNQLSVLVSGHDQAIGVLKGNVDSISAQIKSAEAKLDEEGMKILTQALQMFAVDPATLKEGEEEKKANANIQSGIDLFIRLLSGEDVDLKDVIEEQQRNMV